MVAAGWEGVRMRAVSRSVPFQTKAMAMDMIKAMIFGAILSATIALVIGSQSASAGPLAIHAVHIAEAKMFWSWPIFFSGSGLTWGIMLLQR